MRYDFEELARSPLYPPQCVPAKLLSHVRLCETLWTLAHQAPVSQGFSRQEYWSGLPCFPPGDLPNPGIEPVSLMSPALAGFFTTRATWEAHTLPSTKYHPILSLLACQHCLQKCMIAFFFFLHISGVIVPRPGIETVSPALAARRLNH